MARHGASAISVALAMRPGSNSGELHHGDGAVGMGVGADGWWYAEVAEVAEVGVWVVGWLAWILGTGQYQHCEAIMGCQGWNIMVR